MPSSCTQLPIPKPIYRSCRNSKRCGELQHLATFPIHLLVCTSFNNLAMQIRQADRLKQVGHKVVVLQAQDRQDILDAGKADWQKFARP